MAQKVRLYTIYDRVAEEAGPLFPAVNDGIAIRNYRNVLEQVPEYQRGDYRLYYIGEFDPHTMIVVLDSMIPEIIYEREAGDAR